MVLEKKSAQLLILQHFAYNLVCIGHFWVSKPSVSFTISAEIS